MIQYLQPRIRFGERPAELCDAFSVPSQDTVLNVLQCKHFSSNQVAHIIEELKKKKGRERDVMLGSL